MLFQRNRGRAARVVGVGEGPSDIKVAQDAIVLKVLGCWLSALQA